MTEHKEDDQGAAVAAANELSLLSPYFIGQTLRRWYLSKRRDHHLHSAYCELKSAEQHTATALHFLTLATAVRGALEELEEK